MGVASNKTYIYTRARQVGSVLGVASYNNCVLGKAGGQCSGCVWWVWLVIKPFNIYLGKAGGKCIRCC